MSRPLTVMLVAAEASGDNLGAGLARALKAKVGADKVRFVGVGGPRMAEQGVESPFDITDLSILGWIEGVRAYGRVKRRVAETVELAVREKPDVAVLIDSWGFTIRVAKGLRAALPDLKIVKYVGPQVWASRPGRARTLAGAVDHLMTLHGFDPPWFEKEGLPTTFVGNPSLAIDFSQADGARFRQENALSPEQPLLLILPGSRPAEIMRMTPVFEQTARRLKAARPDLAMAVVVADTIADDLKGRVAGWPFRCILVEGDAAKKDAMKAATVALATSGTVSTELALAGVPMVIAYRLGGLSFALTSRLMTARHITLFNIAADKRIAPEYLQNAATPEALAQAVAERLDRPELRAEQIAEQTAALDLMGRGQPDPSAAAADVVLSVVQAR
ncbi:lipid-A-disaccharide synthase [Brevundimonas aveniformis]|uniref:lipid-A-disaccharide synthase n=1 Tax=Brevundimonas aveniformis TaxID=370977 RepID=UPI0024915269|nr:lipid-A-disaccharide synthase [Brevundimonas aveniformis]